MSRLRARRQRGLSRAIGHRRCRRNIIERRRCRLAREERVEEERRTTQRSVENVVGCRVEPDGGTYGGVCGGAKNSGGSVRGVDNWAGINLRGVRCEQGYVSYVDTHERRAVNP
eukprot:5401120-Pleurochrysis_carterae.AAC.1